jgi:hypothetical protein
MTEIGATKEELEKARKDLERSLERARRFRIESETFLRVTRPRRERIRADLRRAGLLRD